MPGTVLSMCVYAHARVFLRTSQSGEDDNCPCVAEEEKEAWRAMSGQGGPGTELGQAAFLPPHDTGSFTSPCPHHSRSCFTCSFSLALRSTLVHILAESGTRYELGCTEGAL